jgi:glycosyltransferase involved in cell wall biosynthesis
MNCSDGPRAGNGRSVPPAERGSAPAGEAPGVPRHRPLRVLCLNATAELGGTDTDLVTMIRALDRAAFEPVVVLPHPGPLDEAYRALDVEVRYLPLRLPGRHGRLTQQLRHLAAGTRGIARLAALIDRERIDLVYCNSLLALPGAPAARLAGRPCVVHSGELYDRPRPIAALLYHAAGALAERIIVSSETVRRRFPAWCRSRVHTIYNGIDLQRFRPDCSGAEVRRACGFAPDAPVAGFVGRLVPWKGPDRFLEACARVAQAYPPARFLLVGSTLAAYTGYAERLERSAAELGLSGRVAFRLNRTDVPQHLAAMDVFVHASVRPEPFGIVVIEAMAAGRPVIATAAGGVLEIIDHPDAGVLVPPGDVEAMAAAMLALLRDGSRRARLGETARRLALERYDIRMVIQRIEAIFRAAAGSRAGRRPG